MDKDVDRARAILAMYADTYRLAVFMEDDVGSLLPKFVRVYDAAQVLSDAYARSDAETTALRQKVRELSG